MDNIYTSDAAAAAATAQCAGMDATQMINDSILESDEEENEETDGNKRGRPLAKLCILKNGHIPETELPLFLGDNVLGRDPNTCTLPLPAPSISKKHATISISVYRRRRQGEVDIEALLWDSGSMNGTYKGLSKLTPNVRYALSEGDRLKVADIPCQYVTCAADTVSSQGDKGTPMCKNSAKPNLPDASGETGGDASTGSKKCVNGGAKARASLPNVKDAKKTPVRGSWLFFEQTPTPPQTTLVPESDPDSDGEMGRGERRHMAHVSDSDSYKSSPSCSTFLSPANKVVPESPITPSSTGNKPHRHVSFSTEETDTDVGRQQLKDKQAFEIVDESEEEEGREEERAALGGGMSEESGQHVPVKEENNVSLTGEDKFPVSKPAVLTGPVPTLNMDSDTDVEGEEEAVASASAGTLNTNQQADETPNTAQFHMDSDTDVDEDDNASDKVPKSVPSFADHTKPPPVVPVIQPQGITMDSDTDLDDDDDAPAASHVASKTVPVSCQSTHTAESTSSIQLEDFHLDSDTDVDEEEESECGAVDTCSKVDSTPSTLHIKPVVPESGSADPHNLHLDSDTDDEAILAPTIAEPAVASTTESCTTADRKADLALLSDSDTDVEEDSPVFIPLVVTDLSVSADTIPEALEPDEDESSMPPAGDTADHFGASTDAGVKNEEVDAGGADEVQNPILQRENTKSFLAPLSQNCSTPLRSSEGDLEEVDTQVFQSPSSVPWRRAVAHAVMHKVPSSCSDSLEEDDVVIAETQPFILYGEDEDPARSSLTDDDDRQATAETQPYLTSSALAMSETQPMSAFDEERQQKPDSADFQAKSILQNETEEREEDGQAAQPQGRFLSESLFVAETQPMHTSDNEESDDEDSMPCLRKRKAKPLQLDDEQTQTQTLSCSESTQPVHISVDATQPMVLSENEESDVGDSVPGPRKRKAKQLRLEDEETQMLTSSELPAAQTQILDAGEHEESDDEDSMPCLRKRKAKPLQLDDEQTQTQTQTQTISCSESSLVDTQPAHISVDATQPMVLSENEESDDEDSVPGPRRRKAKPLPIQDEETQELTNSEVSPVETEPLESRERQRKEEEEKQRAERERQRKEEEEKQRAERERQRKEEEEKQRAERERQRKEEEEKQRAESERQRKEEEEKQRAERERQRKEEEEKQRAERERQRKEEEEKQRAESERQRKEEEKQRAERTQREKEEQLEKARKESEERERLEHEKAEREETERLRREEKAKIDKERAEQEEKQRLETAKRELQERLESEHRARLKQEAKEREESKKLAKEKEAQEEQIKRQQEAKEEANKSKTPARGRRATRRTAAATYSTEAEQESVTLTNDDVPARRTRSRSNSSNSISSERSSVGAMESRGRGRGRGGSKPPRESTAAAGPTDEGSNAPSPQGVLSRSNSSNSLNSEVSSCSLSSQSRGRGARQRGRGRKTKAESVLPTGSLSDQNSTPKASTSGSWSNKADESFEAPSEDNKVKAGSRQARTTRGRQRADANVSATAAEEEVPSNLEEGCATEELPPTKRNVRGRGQKATKSESAEAPETSAVNDGEETKAKRKRRKGELEANMEEDSSSSSKISKRKEKAQPAAAAVEVKEEEEEAKTDQKDDTPVRATRRGRQTRAQAKAEVKEVMGANEGRGRGRTSMVQIKKEEEQEESGPSFDQDAHMEATEPQTPSRRVSRKRNAPALSTPVAKTPRSSSASPAAVGRSRAASQPHKVLFTGVTDEAGERVLVRLGGSMAKGVADMNILVTDKVRRTVKFLCAVAKGVPIVTTDWLEKSGKAGSFLSPNSFVVKDQEQEAKFDFCLQESLRIASSQPFLQGYEIHVTPSVKPEPPQMKDIITCSGATFLAKMPSTHKLHTVVVSCEEDWLLCGPALAASLPVVTAEFLLTGILQQRVDLQTHSLSAPVQTPQPAGGRSRSRRKT